jgi:hypothetical protein
LNTNAPSVDFPVGRFFMGAYFVVGLSVVTAGVFAGSYVAGDLAGWRAILMLLVWLVVSLGSIKAVLNGQPKCWLSWNGNTWQIQQLQFENIPQQGMADSDMSVHLDLQQFLLVSLRNEKGSRQWFWVTQTSFPERWHGFRCAVYSQSS